MSLPPLSRWILPSVGRQKPRTVTIVGRSCTGACSLSARMAAIFSPRMSSINSEKAPPFFSEGRGKLPGPGGAGNEECTSARRSARMKSAHNKCGNGDAPAVVSANLSRFAQGIFLFYQILPRGTNKRFHFFIVSFHSPSLFPFPRKRESPYSAPAAQIRRQRRQQREIPAFAGMGGGERGRFVWGKFVYWFFGGGECWGSERVLVE